MFPSVARAPWHHYNSRAEKGPVWTDSHMSATNRRLADGRGVFSAGGIAGQQQISHSSNGGKGPPGTTGSVAWSLPMLFWGIDGHRSGYSALLGGLTCVIPNAFLALRLVVPRRDPGAGALVRAAYIGELGKLALTVLMFSIGLYAGAAAGRRRLVCRFYLQPQAGDVFRVSDA